MTTIRTIIADGDGVKGRRFVLDLTRPTLVVGPNGSGKSARLLACHLALGTRIGGSATPAQLGDIAADCGRVELGVEGETSDGRPLRLTRILGAKHEARLSIGDEPLVKDAKGVEAGLAAHLGAQRMQPTDLADFISLTTEKQAALVAKVAGVTLADPAIRADLDDRLRRTEVEYDDARGQPRQGRPDAAQLAAVAEALAADGLEGAKEHARVQKNEWQRRKAEAEKARGRLVDLRRDDLPPGTLADAQARERRVREELTAVREKLAARAQAQAERQRAAARVETARQRVTAAEQRPGAAAQAPAEAAPGAVAQAQATADAATARRKELGAAAVAAHNAAAEVEAKLRDVRGDLSRIDQTLVALADGHCPTCGTTGGALDAARSAIQEKRTGLARREAVLGVRGDAARRAADDAYAAASEAENAERSATDALRAAHAAAQRAASGERARSEAAAVVASARSELVAAEQALAALPPLEGVGDLEGARDKREADLTAVSDQVARLAGFEEAERLRAANEADLDAAILARATWGALERALGAFGVELARRSAAAVTAHADRIVRPVYGGDPLARGFAFRPLPANGDEPAAWGFGLVTFDAGGPEGSDAWRPYSALSDSEQIVCGVALMYASQSLQSQGDPSVAPFRAVVIDRLEALETDRAIRLVRVLAEEQRAGRLSAVLCAMRVDVAEGIAGVVVPDLAHKLAGSGVAIVQAHRDSPRTPAVFVCDAHQHSPAAVVDEAGAVVPDPPEAGGLEPTDYVFCDGQRIRVDAHRARGCQCGAEVREAAKRESTAMVAADTAKKKRVRAALAAQAETAAAAGEGEAA